MIFLRIFPIAIVSLLPLCVSAGRWDVAWFYAYAALLWFMFATIYTLAPPDVVAERMKPPSDRDKRSRRIAIPLFLSHLVVAGLDARFGWSAGLMPLAVRLLGFACVAGALGLAGWTVLANPFASSAVRIQAERGHRVITTGPYGIVRHPMYLGVFVVCLSSGPALGSWWSLLPLLPIVPVFVRRTLLEDRMLHDELEGYSHYAQRVRFRVVPGVF